jgi:hypothetical protein
MFSVLSLFLTIHQFFYLSMFSFYLSLSLFSFSLSLFSFLSVYSVSLSFSLCSISSIAHPSCLSVCLSVCLSLCVCVFSVLSLSLFSLFLSHYTSVFSLSVQFLSLSLCSNSSVVHPSCLSLCLSACPSLFSFLIPLTAFLCLPVSFLSPSHTFY